MTAVITGPFGPFVYTVATKTWWWSDDLFRILGFEPGEVVPTTDLLVAHKHPGDAAVATTIIENALSSGEPFALWHRVLDSRRRTRNVVSVGDGIRDEGGVLREVRGFMVDVTGSQRSQTARDVDEAVRRSAESRGTIEQAKGIIMASLAVDADAAFGMLKRRSQDTNEKLRDLAAGLLEEVATMREAGLDARKAVEHVLGGAADQV